MKIIYNVKNKKKVFHLAQERCVINQLLKIIESLITKQIPTIILHIL